MNVVAAQIPEDNRYQKFNFIVIIGPLNYPFTAKRTSSYKFFNEVRPFSMYPNVPLSPKSGI